MTIIDVHTIGVAQRTNSGFSGELGWVRDSFSLNNEYYQMLIEAAKKRSNFYLGGSQLEPQSDDQLRYIDKEWHYNHARSFCLDPAEQC